MQTFHANKRQRIARSTFQYGAASGFRVAVTHNPWGLICQDCRSTRMIEHHAEGDIVCLGCGLVNMERIIDDTPLVRSERNLDYVSFDEFSTAACPEVERALDWLGMESQAAIYIIQQVVDEHKAKEYNGCWDALYAYATLRAAQMVGYVAISEQNVCDAYDVEPSALKTFEERETASNVREVDIRQRIARPASAVIDDGRDRASVATRVSEIEATLKTNPQFASKRPSKMDVVILYYVHVVERGQKGLTKKKFADDCGVSTVTFNKHLKLLTELLGSVIA